MSPEDLKRLEAIQSTVTSDGWNYLIEDILVKVDAMKEEFLNPQVTLDLIRFGQGRVSVYKEIIGLRSVVERVLDDANAPVEELDV
ncbi:MAG: hypothetical protein KGL39_08690 [Patescibacteria group bacterium]|nr:hypothetical protein [Patescibacteria group bacterium]